MTITKTIPIALLLILTACATSPAPKTASGDSAGNPASPAATAQNNAPGNAAASAAAEPAKTLDDSYVIQPGDFLGISVWQEPTLDKDVLVRPDGALSFPLTGDVPAAGKSVEQLRKELTTKLTKFVPDPVVTVTVKAVGGNKIYVMGKVNKPGEYVTNRSVDVMQILSMAGGLSPFASSNKIKILRRENGELKSIPFRYSDVEQGENMEQNIMLRGGDIVVVP